MNYGYISKFKIFRQDNAYLFNFTSKINAPALNLSS